MAETNTSENLTIQNILDGKTDFLTLDFTSAQDRTSALNCLNKKQLLARRLNVNNHGQLEVLKLWVESKYENILVLTAEQRNKELIDIFLEGKFRNQLAQWAKDGGDPFGNSVALIHSYTKQQLICYNYETKEGEAVSYFDETLGIPVKLKTEASLKLKLTDALKLVKKIDIELERVDLTITINLINNIITDCLRSALLEIIDGQKISYYDIPKHYPEIRDALTEQLQSAFAKCGLSLSDLKLNDIYLTNDIDEQLENQYFALAKIARVKEFEYKLEEQSLKLYEQKAKIHSHYPDFQPGLTEAEKDLALERYLKRVGKAKEVTVKVHQEVLPDRVDENTDSLSSVTINAPTEPTPPIPSKKYRVGYGIVTALWAILTVVLCVLEDMLMYGIIIGAVGFVGLLICGIILRYQLKYGLSKAEKEDYDQKLEAYHKSLEEYNQKDSTLKGKRPARAEKPAEIETAQPAEITDSKQE